MTFLRRSHFLRGEIKVRDLKSKRKIVRRLDNPEGAC